MKICCTIILIDNDKDEVELLLEVIRERALPFVVQYFKKKEDAEVYLEKSLVPNVILVDVEPGDKDWKEWLVRLRGIEGMRQVPVVIYTTVYDWEITEYLQEGEVLMQLKPVNSVGYETMLNDLYKLCKPKDDREVAAVA